MNHATLDGRTLAPSRALAALALTTICWASAFAGTRLALGAYSPAHVALLRYGTASIVLAVFAALTAMPLPRLRDLIAVAPIAFVGITFYNLALGFGQTRTPAGTSSLIIASAPIWMTLIGVVTHGERPGRAKITGIVASALGVVVIVLGSGRGLGVSAHALVLAAAAIAQAVYSVGQRRLVARFGAMRFLAYAVWTGTVLLLPFSSGLLDAVRTAPAQASLATIYLGVVPGALGYGMWAYGTARTSSATAGSFLYLVPAVAMTIAWLVLGEVPTMISLAGGALVIAGVIVVQRSR
jgi:drug/metabolite transporter (DMT)-like permease